MSNDEELEDIMYNILYDKLLEIAHDELDQLEKEQGNGTPFTDDEITMFDLGVTLGAIAYERMMFEFANPNESS